MKVNSTVSLAVQKKYAVNDALTMYRASGIVQCDDIHPLPSGNLSVRSTSRLSLFHQINPKYGSCNCEAGSHNLLCVHLVAWLVWRAQNFELARDTAIATREKQVALVQRERGRTEWVEELDI